VAVRLEHAPHAERGAQLEQPFVLVGRVDQHGVAGGAAPHDEDVVVDGADHGAVHLDAGVPPVQGAVGRHAASIAPPAGGA